MLLSQRLIDASRTQGGLHRSVPTLAAMAEASGDRPGFPDDASNPVLTRMLRDFPQPTGLTDAEVSAHLAASLGGAGFCEDGDLCS